MSPQVLLERLAELQLLRAEADTAAAQYVAERERIVLEHTRRCVAAASRDLPPLPSSGAPS